MFSTRKLVGALAVLATTAAVPVAAAQLREPVPIPLEFCNGLQADVVGTEQADTLFADADGSVIVAKGGDDIVLGRGGDDTICAGDGSDKVLPGDGSDTVFGEQPGRRDRRDRRHVGQRRLRRRRRAPTRCSAARTTTTSAAARATTSS